jgi:hypothetical protein
VQVVLQNRIRHVARLVTIIANSAGEAVK